MWQKNSERAVEFPTHQRFAHNGVAELLLQPTRRCGKQKKLPPGPGAAKRGGFAEPYQGPLQVGVRGGCRKVARPIFKDRGIETITLWVPRPSLFKGCFRP